MPFFLNLIVSSVLGVLSGLGIGGGSLLIIWLTMVNKLDYPAATYTNLLFFLPSASITVVGYLMQEKTHLRRVFLAAAAGCVAAVGFTILSSSWNTILLKKLFGGLLLIVALRELKYKKQQKRSQS